MSGDINRQKVMTNTPVWRVGLEGSEKRRESEFSLDMWNLSTWGSNLDTSSKSETNTMNQKINLKKQIFIRW